MLKKYLREFEEYMAKNYGVKIIKKERGQNWAWLDRHSAARYSDGDGGENEIKLFNPDCGR